MTMIAPGSFTLPADMTDFEFDLSCENCDSPATVFMQLSHTANRGCLWSEGRFRCQAHYEARRAEMAEWIKGASSCAKCGNPVTGNLGQNIRVTPL